MTPNFPSQPVYSSVRRVFSLTCRVEIEVHAPADVVWNLLTDSASFPRWNSTVTRIEGAIKEGERIRIHVPGTSRTFTPRVGDVVPNRGMTWSAASFRCFEACARSRSIRNRTNRRDS